MFFGIFKKKPKKGTEFLRLHDFLPLRHLKIPNQKIRGE